jgi:hypothetical protein
MKKAIIVSFVSAVAVWGTVQASPVIQAAGVGAHGFALANNFTALANDFSAVYYNPAGLAFVPVRELNISLIGTKQDATCDLGRTSTKATPEQRLKLSSLGWLRSIPTSQGGLACAIGFSSPYLTDDVNAFSGQDVYNGQTFITELNDTVPSGSKVLYKGNKLLSFGQLDLWSLAAGIQVAPGFGIGLTASLVTGSNDNTVKRHSSYLVDYPDRTDSLTRITSTHLTTSYLGYDFRIGFLYQANDMVRTGLRVELPRRIGFSQTETVVDSMADGAVTSTDYKGKLTSPLSGALGAALTLPFAIVSSDLTFRSPQAGAPDNSELQYWKIGLGAGIEIPISAIKTNLRLGYSWQQLDLYPMQEEFDGVPPEEDNSTLTTVRDRHLLTGGIMLLLGKSVALEAAYGYSFWKVSSTSPDYASALIESHVSQRGVVSLTMRY